MTSFKALLKALSLMLVLPVAAWLLMIFWNEQQERKWVREYGSYAQEDDESEDSTKRD